MSMLSEVKKDLYANKNIAVVDISIDRSGAGSYFEKRWETVDIVVAPKKGIYEADKLQALMEQLTPSVRCSDSDSFSEGSHAMSFGKLYFDEVIGTEKRNIHREIILTDEDFLSKGLEGFVDGKRIIKEEKTVMLERRTWVRLYPNLKIALEAVHNGTDRFHIDMEKLAKSKGRFASLLARLGYKS